MSRLLGIITVFALGLTLSFLFSKTANQTISDYIVRYQCQVGNEKSCHQFGQRSAKSNRTRYMGAKALAVNCQRNNFVQSCLPAAQTWEFLDRLDYARDAYEYGCGRSDTESCFAFYMFLTRNADYVSDARQTMEYVCNGGRGDHSACVFTTIVLEEEGRIDDALRVVKAMCDTSPSAPECWSTAEFMRARGDVRSSANYYYMACKLGEARACQSYSDIYALDSQMVTQSATGYTDPNSFQGWVRQAMIDIEKFGNLVEKNPTNSAVPSLEIYQQKWKFYGQNVALMQPNNPELVRAKNMFQQSLHDFDMITQLMIRGLKAGSQPTNQKHLRVALRDAFTRGAEVEKVLARFPASR